jgi:N-acetylglucosamine kinase-like BadF-type ATPase
MSIDGSIISSGRGGPSNPITLGVERSLNNIKEAVDNAIRKIDDQNILSTVLGLAGASRSRLGDDMLSRFPKHFGYTQIVSDARSALAGATACEPGVVVIAGTGSIAFGLNKNSEEAKAGGWGWRLGDEGSGYTIGNNAMIAALRAYDGSGPETILKELVLEHLGINDIEKVIDWTYDPRREPRHFASLVPLVKEAEKKNDEVATQIMINAGIQLAQVTQAVIKRLNLTEDFPIACSGGVFKQPNRYNLAFEETVRKIAPSCEFIEPLFSPTIGSAFLALQSIGVEISENLLANTRTSKVNI